MCGPHPAYCHVDGDAIDAGRPTGHVPKVQEVGDVVGPLVGRQIGEKVARRHPSIWPRRARSTKWFLVGFELSTGVLARVPRAFRVAEIRGELPGARAIGALECKVNRNTWSTPAASSPWRALCSSQMEATFASRCRTEVSRNDALPPCGHARCRSRSKRPILGPGPRARPRRRR